MNIGSLYKVKQNFWLLFPTKETAATAIAATTTAAAAADYADYWIRDYKCEVTYFSPDSIIIFLEEDGKYKKILTSDGIIGWTWFTKNFDYCFKEVSNE